MDNSIVPVIAGLALGIAFIAVFGTLFFISNQPRPHSTDHFLWLEIDGMKENYTAGEKIDFVLKTQGYEEHVCGYPQLKIIDAASGEEIIGIGKDMFSLMGGCDPDVRDVNETWTLQQMGVVNDIEIQEGGNYKLLIEYGNRTIIKEFSINRNNNSSKAVNCNESTLCTFQLKADNSTYPIHFRMDGTVQNMTIDVPTKTLTIKVNVENSTNLQIALPRDVIDAKSGMDGKSGSDVDFAVFVDQQNVDANEYSTNESKRANTLGITEHPEKLGF